MKSGRGRGSSVQVLGGVVLVVTVGAAASTRAACNVIPEAPPSFRAAAGRTNRPFAGPGEPVQIDVRSPGVCPTGLPAFAPDAADNVVTVVFTPPTGARSAVVIQETCNGFAGSPAEASCQGALGGGTVACLAMNQSGTPSVRAAGTGALVFTFPDTDALLAPPGDGVPLAGPATIAVTLTGSPLPCALATTRCADSLGLPGLVACVDELYAGDGTCRTATQLIAPTFGHFTALPPPNDYQAACTITSPPCTDDPSAVLRVASDAQGNLLIPTDWRGVQAELNGVPTPRLVRVDTAVPINYPAGATAFLASFAPEGALLGPIFDQQADPTTVGLGLFGSADAPYSVLRLGRRAPVCSNTLRACRDDSECPAGDVCTRFLACTDTGGPCTQAADCPAGACAPTVCSGGMLAGSPCSADGQCPGGECGPDIYDFRPLTGPGPLMLPRPNYAARAEETVSLESLIQTPDVSVFVTSESTAGALNGDLDSNDPVVTLRDRTTGARLAIGPAGSPGRAIARLRQPPFAFPAAAAEGTLVAFLEPEILQGATDNNGNGDLEDAILRVYRTSPTAATLLSGAQLTADPAPLVNGAGLAVVNDRVFFRAAPRDAAPRAAQFANQAFAGGAPTDFGIIPGDMSVDPSGRWVTFASISNQLIAPGTDTLGFSDVFTLDTTIGSVTRMSEGAGGEANGASGLAIPPLAGSPAGTEVAFASDADNLVPGDLNGVADVFVRRMPAATTVRVSVSGAGVEGDQASGPGGSPFGSVLAISADGRFVAFPSLASTLDDVVTDTNGFTDVYLRDRDVDDDGIYDEPGLGATSTTRMSLAADGVTQGNADSGWSGIFPPLTLTMTPDGRYVAFASLASNLVPGDTNGGADIFVRDRLTGTLERVSVDSDGNQGLPMGGLATGPTLSADGRYVSFVATYTNLVPGLAGGPFGRTFVHDRLTGVTSFEAPGLEGLPGDGATDGVLSGDGRWIILCSESANLVPGDTNNATDVFLRDRWSGITTRLSVTPGGAQTPGDPPIFTVPCVPTASHDGSVLTFASGAGGITAGDTNGLYDGFVRREITPPLCGNSVLDPDEECDPPLSVGGTCPGVVACSTTCQCRGVAEHAILRVFDAGSSSVTDVCPATQVEVAGDMVAFLRPESGAPVGPSCPTGSDVLGGEDLNGDGDATDTVVHLLLPASGSVVAVPLFSMPSSPASDLALAALCESGSAAGRSCRRDEDCPSSACRASTLGFATREVDPGGSDLNGDGDTVDTTIQYAGPLDCSPFPACLTPTVTGFAGRDLQAAGDVLAFLVPEAEQGGTDLNADLDAADLVPVLHLPPGFPRSMAEGALDLVLGDVVPGKDHLLAYRRDTDEHMQVHDITANVTYDTGVRAVPCRLVACDPRRPYRIFPDNATVRFLSTEADIALDVNLDGDFADLVVMLWTLATNTNRPLFTVDVATGGGVDPLADTQEQSQAAVSPGGRCWVGATQLLVPGSCTPGVPDTCPPDAVCLAQPVTIAAPDSDGDGLTDALDNCPFRTNQDQADGDADGVGDACDQATCGNGLREADEECDGTDAGACGAPCRTDCTCVCGNLVTSPEPKVVVKTLNGLGKLTAKLTVPYAGSPNTDPVSIRLEDGDSPSIVRRALGILPPRGTSGTRWLYKASLGGLQKVLLRDLAPAQPGLFLVKVKGKGLFTYDDADEGAATTSLTVTLGSQCFRAIATKKVD